MMTIFTIYTNDFSALDGIKASSEEKIMALINDYFDCISFESKSINQYKPITYKKEYVDHSNGSFNIIGFRNKKEFYINIICERYKGE